jgi:hypothetical protein
VIVLKAFAAGALVAGGMLLGAGAVIPGLVVVGAAAVLLGVLDAVMWREGQA